jgi:hypothetical protein
LTSLALSELQIFNHRGINQFKKMQTLEEENKFVVASSTEQHFSKFMRAL